VLRSDLLKLIAEFAALSGENPPVIVGSQAFYAITDRLPEIARKSIECDFLLSSANFSKRIEIDENLGVFSEFQARNGYFADALGKATVVLPKGWEDRLMPLSNENGDVVALCADPHDVAVAKIIAGREKDHEFLVSALNSELIDIAKLRDRLDLAAHKVENDTIVDRLKRFADFLVKRRDRTFVPFITEHIEDICSKK